MTSTVTDERTAFELEYWKLVLADVTALSDLIERAADTTMDIPVLALEALVMPDTLRGPQLVKVSAASRNAMNTLAQMAAPLARLVQLVAGRVEALREAA